MTKMVSWMSDEKQCDKHQKKMIKDTEVDVLGQEFFLCSSCKPWRDNESLNSFRERLFT